MSPLWIVDRNPRRRAALARLAAAGEDTVLGAPGEPRFDSAPTPEAVLLGLDGDWELELQFAHACGRRAAGALWLLVGDPEAEAEALRCFDARRARFLAWPPRPEALRLALGGTPAPRPPSLSERACRDELSDRFARWFGDLDQPDLLRALDPRLAEVPLRIVGEPGSGRSLVARYVHLFGGTGRGSLAHVPCEPDLSILELADAIAAPARGRPELPALGIWLEDVERLQPAVQRALRSWLECGLPPGTVKAPLLRWIATCDARHAQRLDADLRLALSGLVVRLPTLRERPHAVSRIAAETVRTWCARRGERTRRLGEDALRALEEYPWPCNLRELEAVLVQSLAASTRDPLGADDLLLDGAAFAPTRARDMEALLPPVPDLPHEPGAAPRWREAERLEREVWPEPVVGQREAWHESMAEELGETRGEHAAPVPAPRRKPEAALGSPSAAGVPGPTSRRALDEPLDELELETFLESLDEEDGEPVQRPRDVAPGVGEPGAGDAARQEPVPAPQPQAPTAAAQPLARLVGALARAVRSPLVTLRAFAEALPERFEDRDFRERFVEMVRDDVGRIDASIARLGELVALGPPRREAVDVSALLEELLEARRGRIREQRLLVLKELDSQQPDALCDPGQLRFALAVLLDRCLEWVPPQGDVYLASRHHAPRGPGQPPFVRVLIRFHDPGSGAGGASEVAPEGDPELMIAELVVRAQGGSLGVTAKDGEETLILLDLPAP